MPLTRKEKRRIYEEELERMKARERIKVVLKNRSQSSWAMNWVIIAGFLIMLYIVLGGK
ncbi:hypothetical protein [Sporomusa acidovorans]|uniref:Uncharacterized protein n=1 Tax=Sporomusa acidovorans (strain ATCC 49682 / DSM 3132 / Mol) TaxID=1123286 RepID=A0ABZ3JBL1_SPOA4|nr:hypothetical protein [Sporomusa acidovorans]OZC13301.1 hypothetical protein SPACI_57960 [Sporomusa acidovorans DSM 3132]SDD97523.1 hypothetical protein SAMN04488499_100653 [Sporomusa acidovorans]